MRGLQSARADRPQAAVVDGAVVARAAGEDGIKSEGLMRCN